MPSERIEQNVFAEVADVPAAGQDDAETPNCEEPPSVTINEVIRIRVTKSPFTIPRRAQRNIADTEGQPWVPLLFSDESSGHDRREGEHGPNGQVKLPGDDQQGDTHGWDCNGGSQGRDRLQLPDGYVGPVRQQFEMTTSVTKLNSGGNSTIESNPPTLDRKRPSTWPARSVDSSVACTREMSGRHLTHRAVCVVLAGCARNLPRIHVERIYASSCRIEPTTTIRMLDALTYQPLPRQQHGRRYL